MKEEKISFGKSALNLNLTVDLKNTRKYLGKLVRMVTIIINDWIVIFYIKKAANAEKLSWK